MRKVKKRKKKKTEEKPFGAWARKRKSGEGNVCNIHELRLEDIYGMKMGRA